MNLKSSCRHCSRTSGRSHIRKITPDFRSQSFSQYPEMKRCCFHEDDDSKIFCVEEHRRKANLSSENIRVCCEEKLRCLRKHSPTVSPYGSPRFHSHHVQDECLVHKPKESRKHYPLVRSNARKRKNSHRTESSLSAEDQSKDSSISRTEDSITVRSISFSPTRHLFKSISSAKDDCVPGEISSVISVEKEEKKELQSEQEKDELTKNNTTDSQEPS